MRDGSNPSQLKINGLVLLRKTRHIQQLLL